MAPLAAAAGGYVLLPAGSLRDGAFAVLGLACVLTAFAGLHRNAPARQTGWRLVITGFLGWVVGDALFSLQGVWGVTAYPSPADGSYLVAYVLMAGGLVVMVRRRGSAGDVAAVLDAAILATGVAVVAGVFVVVPIASDSSLSALGKMTSTFYPAADILLLAILVRFWATPSARTTSFRLLICALGFIFVGDVYYTATTILTGGVESELANDLVWYAGYVLIAGATWDRSVHDLAEPAPGLEDVTDPTKRLLVLTGGLLLPAVTLLDGVITRTPITESRLLSTIAGTKVLLKCENLQRAGSFKVRGAYVRLARLSAAERERGVVAASAGNHAQGVALAAGMLGIDTRRLHAGRRGPAQGRRDPRVRGRGADGGLVGGRGARRRARRGRPLRPRAHPPVRPRRRRGGPGHRRPGDPGAGAGRRHRRRAAGGRRAGRRDRGRAGRGRAAREGRGRAGGVGRGVPGFAEGRQAAGRARSAPPWPTASPWGCRATCRSGSCRSRASRSGPSPRTSSRARCSRCWSARS